MTVVCFSEALLRRLAGIARRAEAEFVAAGALSESFLRTGLRPPAAAARDAALPPDHALDDLYRRRRQAFAHIVQFLADRGGQGSIETLGDDALTPFTREAIAACERWEEGEPSEDPPAAALEPLLAAHRDLGEEIAETEDEAIEELGEDEGALSLGRDLGGRRPTGPQHLLVAALAGFKDARRWLERLSTAPPDRIERIGRNFERGYRAFLDAAGAMDEAAREQFYRRLAALPPRKDEAVERSGEPLAMSHRW